MMTQHFFHFLLAAYLYKFFANMSSSLTPDQISLSVYDFYNSSRPTGILQYRILKVVKFTSESSSDVDRKNLLRIKTVFVLYRPSIKDVSFFLIFDTPSHLSVLGGVLLLSVGQFELPLPPFETADVFYGRPLIVVCLDYTSAKNLSYEQPVLFPNRPPVFLETYNI